MEPAWPPRRRGAMALAPSLFMAAWRAHLPGDPHLQAVLCIPGCSSCKLLQYPRLLRRRVLHTLAAQGLRRLRTQALQTGLGTRP